MSFRKTLASASLALIAGGAAAQPATADNDGLHLSIGGIALARTPGDTVPLFDTGFATTTLDTSSGAYTWLGGVDMQLEAPMGRDYIFELRSILTTGEPISTSATNPNSAGFADINGGLDFGLFGGGATMTAVSKREQDFISAEVNVGRELSSLPIKIFVGGRFVNITDDLDMNISTAQLGGGVTRAAIGVKNTLFGAQAGFDADIFKSAGGQFTVAGGASVGYYANSAAITAANSGLVLGTTTPGALINTATVNDSGGTFGVDAEISAKYKASEKASVELGYKLMYFDNIASSTKSLGSSFVGSVAVPTPVPAGSYESALYHGLTLRGVFKF